MNETTLQLANLGLNLLLIPGIFALTKLSKAIDALKFEIYTQFISREQFDERLKHEREIFEKRASQTQKAQDYSKAVKS